MSNSRSTGRSVLIVGASRGIGAAVAEVFAAGGDRVVGTHRGSGVPVSSVRAVKMDVRDAGSVDSAVSEVEPEFGPFEIVVCNAGITDDGLLVRMSEEQYRDVLEVNQFGVFRVVRRVLPAMLKARRGSIVLLSSISARTGIAGQANYGASKAALEGFARATAKEYASRGIRINVVAPGATDTDMVSAMPERARRDMLAEVPMGRLAEPREIAEVVWWLADATYVTGVTVPVAGGAGLGF